MSIINIISLYIFLFYPILSVIIFDFKKQIPKIENKDKFLDYLTINQYITTISIGNPIQNIPININLNKEYFFIFGNETSGIYNEKLSSSYETSYSKIKSSYSQYFYSGFESNETININNLDGKKLNILKFPFILVKEKSPFVNFIFSGGIGLGYNEKSSISSNFLKQLYNRKYINSFAYYIQFNENNENEGKLYIGNYPHEFEQETYSYKYFIYYSTTIKNDFNWKVPFDYFEFYGDKITISSIDFNYTLGGITANNAFKLFFDENFFFHYYKNKICDFQTQAQKTFIYCNENFNVQNFSNITFYSKLFNYTFILSYKELFKKDNNIYYFLIIFDKNSFENFQFGEIFFRKYPFVFDQDRKILGFYISLNLKQKFISISSILIFVLLVFCVFLSICLIIFIIKRPKKKLRAKELEDNYNFFPINK